MIILIDDLYNLLDSNTNIYLKEGIMQNKVLKINKYLRMFNSVLLFIFNENRQNNINEAYSLKTEFLFNNETAKCLVVRGEGEKYR